MLPQVLSEQKSNISLEEVKVIVQHLVVIQSVFSGLMLGKMVEGNIIAGLKHSGIKLVIGLTVFTLGSYLI